MSWRFFFSPSYSLLLSSTTKTSSPRQFPSLYPPLPTLPHSVACQRGHRVPVASRNKSARVQTLSLTRVRVAAQRNKRVPLVASPLRESQQQTNTTTYLASKNQPRSSVWDGANSVPESPVLLPPGRPRKKGQDCELLENPPINKDPASPSFL